MRFLWNHDRISYGRAEDAANPDGSTRRAAPVKYDNKPVGWVTRAEHGKGWVYLVAGNEGREWVGFYETRADAADHLLSAWSPSAAWLA